MISKLYRYAYCRKEINRKIYAYYKQILYHFMRQEQVASFVSAGSYNESLMDNEK